MLHCGCPCSVLICCCHSGLGATIPPQQLPGGPAVFAPEKHSQREAGPLSTLLLSDQSEKGREDMVE